MVWGVKASPHPPPHPRRPTPTYSGRRAAYTAAPAYAGRGRPTTAYAPAYPPPEAFKPQTIEFLGKRIAFSLEKIAATGYLRAPQNP